MICYKFIATDGWMLILLFSYRCPTLQIGCGIVWLFVWSGWCCWPRLPLQASPTLSSASRRTRRRPVEKSMAWRRGTQQWRGVAATWVRPACKGATPYFGVPRPRVSLPNYRKVLRKDMWSSTKAIQWDTTHHGSNPGVVFFSVFFFKK